MASINLEKVKTLYGNSTDLQGQFIDYLRNVESELDFSKFEGLDNQAIFTNLMESGQKEIKVNPNNPAKPLNYRPRREQTYKELKALDDELKNQPFYKDLAMRATQVLDQINPTPFRQKELEARRHKAQEILNHLKKSGVTSEQFAKEYGDSPFLREAYFENQDIFSNILDLSHDTSAALFGGKNAQAKAYDFELESYNTYKTLAQRKLDNPSNYYKLTPQEREIIDQRLGAFSAWWHNDSDKEKVDLYLDLENAKESASNFVSAQKRLENVNSNEQFLGLIGALKHGKEFDKKQKAMIDDYAIVAKELGFDTLAYNKTGLYFIKDEKAYKVEQGLWDEIKGVFKDNIGSLAGAIAGAEYGYKKGKFKGMVIYGAAGAFGGGVTDSMIADVLANKKVDLAQALIHGAQEGALNIAADAVLKVAGTAIKTLNPEKLKNIAGTAIDYTPLLGFAKRAKDGNKAAAQKLIDHTIPQEAQADLKALESIFGAEVQIGASKVSQAQSALNSLESKLGSDSYIVRGAQSLYDTFAFNSQKQAQKDFIRAIRADESGNLTAFLSEAANASPVIQKNLLNILDQTSQKLAHQLGRFDLPPSTIKDVFDNFERGTKQSYTDAIEQILLKVYDESYTTTLAKDAPNIPSNLSSQEAARFNTDSLEGFKAKMEKSGILLEDSAKFLRFVESTIYNPKGVTFETLNNAQKTLNAYYKQATDPNFRNFVKDAVNGFIKRDIQAGIEKIFAQNAPLYNDARTLFDTALSDYAKMKETLKLADSLKIRDRRRSYDQVAQSLSRFFLGQGDNIPNFEALLGGLQKELREQVELKLLQDMLELSFVKLNDIKVLDSSEFFKRLEPLKGHFHSTSAKDFIKIAQDFHTLFRNDASIARSLSPATTEKIGTSIATTLEGAVKFQVIKALFANIIRLMPHIPFAKRLNESVQGSALRYQLKKALDSSLSVGEFKLELQARAIKGDFTNATREQIAKILGQVENAQESLERATTPSTPRQLDSSLKTSEIKQELLQRLEPILNKPLTNAQGVQAYINHASIDKMLSDKAIAKSVQNGFSKQEHLEAVGDIERLFSISQEAATHSHKGDNPSVIIHRLNAPFKNANALITTKESLDKDKNRIYSVELELTPRFDTPARPTDTEASKGSSSSLNGQGGQDSPTIAKADQGNSTTLSPLEQAQAQKQATQEAQEATKLAQRQADQATAQAIKDKNDQIQHLKDSRAGKGEMEREVQLGQPIAMKRTEQPPTSIATDDNNIYQLDFVIVKARDVKPNFNADGLQPRTQKEHKTIESIAQNFKPEMVLGRGGYKDLPIIAKDGQVITGNHRVQGFKDFTQESRAAYEKAIKDRFNIELASDELLLRTPSDDLSVKELLSIAYNSNKEDIKNLGDHIYSVLGRYAPNFAKLPRQLESSSVQELKSKIARILDPSPYPNENDANLALLANTIKADKNANITEMLNAFSKLDKEDAARTLNTFTDTAGLWHILSNNAVEYGLKQLDLRPYLLGAMYKSATSQHTTRAANFKELNAQIKHILDTTDASGSNMMLEIMPNTYDNLIADLLGASLARFMRLENPSSNLYEALKGANSGIREQLAPRLDFAIGFTAGRNIEQADIFDFIEYMIREGDKGKEVAEAVELLPKLREKYNAFKGKDSALGRHSGDSKDFGTTADLQSSSAPKSLENPTSPTATPRILETESTPPPKVDSSLNQELKDTPKKSQREQVKQQLQSIKNIDITHKSGIVARLSSTGIDKMLSDKAIQKSLDNGFTKEQHFNAVANIENLFKNSDFLRTEAPKNQSADIVGIHRYINAQDLQAQNAQALITLKESIENGNRIYSVELEGLTHPSSVDRSPKSKGVENSHHDDAGATKAARLFENPSDIIPQSHTALSEQAKDYAHQILQGLRKTAQTPLNKLADEVHSTDRKFMLREAKYIKQRAQELADNFANLRWQDLRSAIRYAKVPYNEAMFKELKESIESREFYQIIESSYPHKQTQKSLFDTQELTPPKDTQTPAETPAQKVDSSDLPLKPATAQEAKELIESITPAPMPAHLSEQEFLEGFEHFINKENFLAHLHKAQDSKQRIEALNLVEPTRKNADIELETINAKGEKTKEFIKVFEGENKRKFYVLVTQTDNENFLLTGIPISRQNKIIKRINEAQSLKARDSQGVSTLQSHTSPELKADSTTKTFNQAQTPPREIPEQDLPYHAEKELYAELEALKPLKKELAQLKQSGEWRSKQGRARRKELDEKIKDAEARGIDTYKIKNTNAKNYEKFLNKYGDMEYFRELAQEHRDKYIQGLEKRIKELDNDSVIGEHGVIFTKQSLIDILEKTRGQELDIDMEIWRVAHDMAELRDRSIKRQTEAQDRTGFNTKVREQIQRALGIKPIAEFGENYAEHYRDGVGAIEKLLLERNGQVAGAFYRKELGDIDLVWGDSNFGLKHILERRKQDFIEKGFSEAEAEQKALEFVKSLPDIIENGSIDKGGQRVFLDTENERAVIALDYNGIDRKWVLTGYIKDDKAPISAYPHQNKLTDSTSSPIVKSALTDEIIPQPPQKSLFDTQESTSNPPPSQPPQAQRLKEALQIPLTDDRGLQSLAFGRVGSDAEIMEQVLIPQARNAHRKGTSQNKLEVAARNALKKHRQDLEQSLNITPIKEFGTNYAEHYRDGKGAIEKLLLEKQGQVSGAFYRKELGDIDLVWGEVQGKGKEAKGWGLAKIIEKHLNAGDFKAFGEGEAGLINAMSEIIQNGKVVTQNGVDSIVLRKNGEEYRVGISKGWDNVGENKWIITSYKNNKYKESAETSYHDTFTSKEPLENLATDIIPQPTQKSLFDT